MHVDKSLKKIQAEVRPPPSRQCLYFGKFWTGIPSLRMTQQCTLEEPLIISTVIEYGPLFYPEDVKKVSVALLSLLAALGNEN